MTNEERDIISQFIARVGGAAQQSSFAPGSVPAPQQQALPPIDREADAYIAQLFNQFPEARYRITQLAFVQERALIEAQNRIKRLEWEVQQARQAAQAAQQQAQSRSGGGLFGGLFGGNRQQSAPPPGGPWNQGGPQQQYAQAAPPPPQYPPNYQPGMLPRQGSGFLGSALTTAAGVAGGLVVGNALMDLFSPHHGGLGGFEGAAAPSASPWAAPPPGQDYTDAGSWDNTGSSAAPDQDYVDNSSWDQSGGGWDQGSSDNSGWDNSSDGGGWDGGGSSDDTY